ncbi:MAG TPA: pilus assembly PilX N-terminal domain-containing protein [Candidatus Saccharimonadia bacterium]|nr:pilus assembly PilX N-terminal domain-containing protein [Candidatus Saccharimonadia bacterium]
MSTTFQRNVGRVRDDHGQIALIVLLIMAVVLTIGLAVASRTVMDVSLSRQEQSGSQTFQAAESGVENALNTDLTGVANGTQIITNQSVGNATVNVTVNTANTIQTRVEQGDAIQVQLGTVVGLNKFLRVYWALGDACPNRSALLMRVYNLNGANYTARNYAVTACATANGFTLANGAGANGYPLSYDVPLAANDRMVSIHPLGDDTQLSVAGVNFALPVQYYTINAKATNNSGSETKAITVTKTIAGFPGILDYTLYSGATLNQ